MTPARWAGPLIHFNPAATVASATASKAPMSYRPPRDGRPYDSEDDRRFNNSPHHPSSSTHDQPAYNGRYWQSRMNDRDSNYRRYDNEHPPDERSYSSNPQGQSRRPTDYPNSSPQWPRRDSGQPDRSETRSRLYDSGYNTRSQDYRNTPSTYGRAPEGRRGFASSPLNSSARPYRDQEHDAEDRRPSQADAEWRPLDGRHNPAPYGETSHHGPGSRAKSTLAPGPSPNHRQSPRRSREPTPAAEFVVPLPPEDYIELSKAAPAAPKDLAQKKLLVLDLNGALIYRTERQSAQRRSYPRPFMSCFMEYLFLPEPDSASRPYDVLVWSSAQPHNVRKMVELAFDHYASGIWEPEDKKTKEERGERDEGRLVDVWARDRMNLSRSDYSRKVQTVKDLRIVLANMGDQYSQGNVVLLDDSPLKAILQPWSQIVIPEYDRKEFLQARYAASRLQDRTDIKATNGATKGVEGSNQPLSDGDQMAAPSNAAAGSNPVAPQERSPVNGDSNADGSDEEGMDTVLLAVIGILERLRNVDNVPAWIRRSGLEKGEEGPKRIPPKVSLETLPSHKTFQHWFNIPEVYAFWVQCGKDALIRKGIRIRHGITVNGDGEPIPLHSVRLTSPGTENSSPAGQSPLPPGTPTPAEGVRAPPSQLGKSAQPPTAIPELRRNSNSTSDAIVAFQFLRTVADGHGASANQQTILKGAMAVLDDLGLVPAGVERPIFLPSSHHDSSGNHAPPPVLQVTLSSHHTSLNGLNEQGQLSNTPALISKAPVSKPHTYNDSTENINDNSKSINSGSRATPNSNGNHRVVYKGFDLTALLDAGQKDLEWLRKLTPKLLENEQTTEATHRKKYDDDPGLLKGPKGLQRVGNLELLQYRLSLVVHPPGPMLLRAVDALESYRSEMLARGEDVLSAKEREIMEKARKWSLPPSAHGNSAGTSKQNHQPDVKPNIQDVKPNIDYSSWRDARARQQQRSSPTKRRLSSTSSHPLSYSKKPRPSY